LHQGTVLEGRTQGAIAQGLAHLLTAGGAVPRREGFLHASQFASARQPSVIERQICGQLTPMWTTQALLTANTLTGTANMVTGTANMVTGTANMVTGVANMVTVRRRPA
jgi:hypothetical protein